MLATTKQWMIPDEDSFRHCIEQIKHRILAIKICRLYDYTLRACRSLSLLMLLAIPLMYSHQSDVLSLIVLFSILSCFLSIAFINQLIGLYFIRTIKTGDEFVKLEDELKKLAGIAWTRGNALNETGQLSAASWLDSKPILEKYVLLK